MSNLTRYLHLEQRSPEWFEWRRSRITASEAAAILGVSPYTSPYQLWMRKKGLMAEQPDNPAMARGRLLEPLALQLYNEYTANMAAPVCVERTDVPWLGASLDGLDFWGEIIAEIKVPGLEDHEKACEGIVPEKYYPQLQHQLVNVPSAKVNHYWSYRPGHSQETALVEVPRDEAFIESMLESVEAFWRSLSGDTPPGGPHWAEHEQRYLEALEQQQLANERVADEKEALISLVPDGHRKLDGERLSVSLSGGSNGSLDYKKAFEAALGLMTEEQQEQLGSLERFRGSPKKGSWRVTVKKGPQAAH
ncbi:lambda-exonuclease family protein [Thioalkalivibrio sp. ALMg11]|uniref:lambda-exonuclease family protein n=1 Tax=Thioalkalivibrio sp. ALMg11 TaxID=1158165 RepID=UPI000373DE9D|nr:YqaJ viral recombinase family protein [Thioalkalivibrio sp. ALMg11]